MIEKILLLCLIVYTNGQTNQPSANGLAQGQGQAQPFFFDLPPLNLQPLQLRLNPTTQTDDNPALLLIRQNESIPVSTQFTSNTNSGSQWPQTAVWPNTKWNQQDNRLNQVQFTASQPAKQQQTQSVAPQQQQQQQQWYQFVDQPQILQLNQGQPQLLQLAPQQQQQQQLVQLSQPQQYLQLVPQQEQVLQFTQPQQQWVQLTAQPQSQQWGAQPQPQKLTAQQWGAQPQTQQLVAQPQSQQWGAQPQLPKLTAQPQSQQWVAQPQLPKLAAQPQSQQWVAQPQPQQLVAQPQSQQWVAQPQLQKLATQPQFQQWVAQPKSQQWAAQPKTQQLLAQPQESKPLVPLAFQPLSQQSLKPLTLQTSAAPKARAQTSASALPSWVSNLQVQAPTQQVARATTKPQMAQTYHSLGGQKQTVLSHQRISEPRIIQQSAQSVATQQNSQLLNRNDVPKESSVNYASNGFERSNINTVLKSLSAYTPNQLPAQSLLFSQLGTQSVVGQQLSPKGVSDKNTKYFPTVTLPAISLQSNELPAKYVDLTQFLIPSTNAVSNQGVQQNPDRSTWSAQAATLNPQTAAAPMQPLSMSSFASLQKSAWSNPSPMENLINQQTQARAQAQAQTQQSQLQQAQLQQGQLQQAQAQQAQLQQGQLQQAQLQQAHLQQGQLQQAQAQQAHLQQGQLQQAQAQQAQLQKAQLQQAQLQTLGQALAQQQQQQQQSHSLQSPQQTQQFPAPVQSQPWSVPSPLQGLPVLSKPPQTLNSAPLKFTASLKPLQSWSSSASLQSHSGASPLKPLKSWSQSAPLQPLPGQTHLKPLTSFQTELAPLKPLTNLVPSQLPSPLSISPLTPPSAQTPQSVFGSNQKLSPLKPFRSAPFQTVPSIKWSNGLSEKQSFEPKLQTLVPKSQLSLPTQPKGIPQKVTLSSISNKHAFSLGKNNFQQWSTTSQNSNGNPGIAKSTSLGNLQAQPSIQPFGARLSQTGQKAQFTNYFKQTNQ